MRTWLILDVPFLAWRAFHTTGGLSYAGTPTGVYYGVLGEILRLESQFQTQRLAFTFDYGKSKRKKLCKEYKATRHKKPREHREEYFEKLQQVRDQIEGLRCNYLSKIGYRNIFWQKGYEADDIIASLCKNLKENQRAIIISADSDLFQCLNGQVELYNPITKKHWTKISFIKHWGIKPRQWAEVKAMTGCSTDDIKGISTCGTKTAIRFLNGLLPEHTKVYKKIISEEGQKIITRNRGLVTLPLNGIKTFRLCKNGELNWKLTMHELGIKTLDTELKYKERDLYTKREIKQQEYSFYG